MSSNWKEHRAKLHAAILDILGDGVHGLTTIQERLQSRQVVVSTIEVRDALQRLDRAGDVLPVTNRGRKVAGQYQDMEILWDLVKGRRYADHEST